MNTYAVVVLVALLVGWLLDLVAGLLTVRSLDPELPKEFEGTFDPDEYRRSQEYTRVRTRFGLLSNTYHLVLLLAFWWLGGFGVVDEWARGLGLSTIPTGLVFMGVLVLLRTVADLPLQLVSTFVIEERYGFNRTSAGTFWGDQLKGLLLTALIGAPLLAAVLFFFESAGPRAWLYAFGLVATFTIVLQVVVPTWIMPLFNRFEPLEEGELRAAILGYANQVNFPLEGLFVIDGSRRSSKANAFFTGFGKRKRVALYDTLIEKHSTEELVAVVAHEIGHYKKRHIVQGTVLAIVHVGILLFLLGQFLSHAGLYEAFGIATPSVATGLVLFGLLYTPVELLLGPVFLFLSRRNEFQADRYSVETTGQPEALAEALCRLAETNLANLTPHWLQVVLHHSHPPMRERLAAIRAAAGAP